MPMPPQAMQESAEGEAPQGGGGMSGKDLVVGVHAGLSKVAELAASTGAPEDVVQDLQSALASFKSAMEKLMGGGGPVAAPAGPGSAAPEAGGNPNAKPM